MKVIPIDQNSPYLSDVKKLWRINSSTLGFFPDGAFIEYSSRRHILVALTPEEKCAGYLLYRISGNKIFIVHLCVDSTLRGKGIAKLLIDYLKDNTNEYWGIGLRCRRDYEASKIWPALNFVPLSDSPGRSITGQNLTYWWFDHGHQTLFTEAEKQSLESKLITVIDANVFFDLENTLTTVENEESKSLLADWLKGSIELCVTNELFVEINRHPDKDVRHHQRKFTRKFRILKSDQNRYESSLAKLKTIFTAAKKLSDKSDLRQLAFAISADAQFFITLDTNILKHSDKIYEDFAINVIRPSELIIRLDELIRDAEYKPIRLAGSLIYINLIKSKQIKALDTFRCSEQGETIRDFKKQINYFLSNPTTMETLFISDMEQKPLALIVNQKKGNKLEVPMIRLTKGSLSATLARHLILKTMRIAADEGRMLTIITDPFLTDEVIKAAQDCAFIKSGDNLLKFNIPSINTAKKMRETIENFYSQYPSERIHLENLSKALSSACLQKDTQSLFNIEKNIWPAKIIDIDIPSFIIPIKPEWALHLFDETLANQLLFGALPELSLSFENVYYRAKHPRIVSSPARILWYVSKAKRYPGSMHVRSCSYLDECIIDTPKNLFRRFRRLGVYNWKDILNVANGNFDKEIMALLFRYTELFKDPISWKSLQEILLSEEGNTSQIQSPVQISSKCFARLYRLGITSVKEPLR